MKRTMANTCAHCEHFDCRGCAKKPKDFNPYRLKPLEAVKFYKTRPNPQGSRLVIK